MSTDDTGDRGTVAGFVQQAKDLLDAERAADPMQLDMLDPISPEDMAEAREHLGPDAGKLAVLRQARTSKRGRPPNARNKRTDDFARYLLSFGQHPAVTMMHIQATPPEVLIANSRRKVRKVVKGPKDGPDRVIEYEEETLTYEGAQSLRIRCAEGLLPYLERKQPVAVDLSFSGISDLIIAGQTHSEAEVQDILEAEFAELPGADVDGEDAA
ncbi:MAG: hypothetical protein ACTHOJ_07485 [Sphingomonas oligoaromativorans]